MSDPIAAREALLIEAIGEAAMLIETVSRVAPALQALCAEVARADAGLRDNLAAFEGRMTAITETAKIRTLQHLAVRAEEATRRSIDQQRQAMTEAARVAFGAHLGSSMERLQALVKPLVEDRQRRWETWLCHVATATAASAATWAATVFFGRG